MNNDTFSHWLKKQRFTITLAIFCACLPIVMQILQNILKLVDASFMIKYINYLSSLCNIIFILVTLILLAQSNFLINDTPENSKRLFKYVRDKFGVNSRIYLSGEPALFLRMRLSFKQFYYSWMLIWGIWLVMYVGNFIYNLDLNTNDIHLFRNECFFENTLNLINSFTLFFIYMVITIMTVKVPSDNSNRRQMHVGIIFLGFIGLCCILFDYHTTLLSTGEQGIKDYYRYQLYIQTFIGIIGCMSLMAVLGRLNSSFLDIPQWLIICLYFYAAIQMFYPFTVIEKIINEYANDKSPIIFFQKNFNYITHSMYIIAFIGKILLFLVIKWTIQKNRFLFFLIQKSNSMIESDEMFDELNRYYDNSSEKKIIL